MSADNAINGVPTCAERGLLTQVLRDQWGFQGFVVSDYDAWVFMAIRDGPTPFAKTVPEAAVLGEHAQPLADASRALSCVPTPMLCLRPLRRAGPRRGRQRLRADASPGRQERHRERFGSGTSVPPAVPRAHPARHAGPSRVGGAQPNRQERGRERGPPGGGAAGCAGEHLPVQEQAACGRRRGEGAAPGAAAEQAMEVAAGWRAGQLLGCADRQL